MPRLEFNGLLVFGDSSRGYAERYDEDAGVPEGALFIGDDDVVDEIHELKWGPKVRAILNGSKIAEGSCLADIASGYSEYTWESDCLCVGDRSVIDLLAEYDGQEVTLVVTDEDDPCP